MGDIGCAPAVEMISAHLDGELDAAETSLLDRHIATCHACRPRAAELEALHRRLRVRPAEAVPDLVAPILAARPAPLRRAGRVWAAVATVLLLVGAALAVGAVLSAGHPAPALAATDAVAPEPSGTVGVVYLALANDGGDDALVGASTDVAAGVELHTVARDEGRLLMRATDALDCSPGLVQDAGSSHVMLRGLHQPLRPGDRFGLELVFERSGTLRVVVDVVAWSELPDRLEPR